MVYDLVHFAVPSGTRDNYSDLDDLLKKSRAVIDKSKNLYDQGSVSQALVQLQISERLLHHAMDISQRTGNNRIGDYKSNLYSLRRYIESVESGLSENTQARAEEFLREARQFSRGADIALNSGDYTEFEKMCHYRTDLPAKRCR